MSTPFRIKATHNGELTEVKTMISHPMETGYRYDQASKTVVPEHFIQTIRYLHNSQLVMEAEFSIAISKDPYLSFSLRNAKPGEQIEVIWTDNIGNTQSHTVTITPA